MRMTHIPGLALLVGAFLLGAAPEAAAAQSHSHDGHGSATVELTLKDGRKWPGDEILRTGMNEIRSAVAGRLARIHEDRLPLDDYRALAAAVQGQIDYVVANCRLPADEDAQLHVVLEQIIDAVAVLETSAQPRPGAVKIVQALNAYGRHFDHPGWQPLGQ